MTIVASASHAALTPALLTPFHVELVVCLMLLIRRHGLALPAFVRMMVGVLLPLASGDEGPRHFCVALHLYLVPVDADRTISSPATFAQIHRLGGVSAGPRV